MSDLLARSDRRCTSKWLHEDEKVQACLSLVPLTEIPMPGQTWGSMVESRFGLWISQFCFLLHWSLLRQLGQDGGPRLQPWDKERASLPQPIKAKFVPD